MSLFTRHGFFKLFSHGTCCQPLSKFSMLFVCVCFTFDVFHNLFSVNEGGRF